ncbi:hypothetical protein INT47_005320 [Mucor saturninus]|uniref:B-block binding subunit of TFIIIC domain-containing protein n=1 Tax=Mucor saturninus TaxID=64648 RepID=A0A8H7V598_9FUNG|nr:hypothetical protein INT47_005320 [Mucor saturninus]
MLDILLSRLKEEIAIDGTSGSSIETVWEYVEIISKDIANKAGTSITPLVDDKYKSFIWNYLKLEGDLEFYENIEVVNQAPAIETTNQANTVSTNHQGPENAMDIDDGLIDNIGTKSVKAPESEVLFGVSKKRKGPPTSKKKTAAKKKAKSKPKPKPKKKKKSSAKLKAGNSDDDFEGGSESAISSSEESDFEQDTSDNEDSEDSEGEDSDEDSESEKHKQQSKPTTTPKQHKNATGKPKTISDNAVFSQIDISDCNFEHITEKYGDRLYITGSAEFQERQLYVGLPPGVVLSPNLVIILKEIIKTRSKGLFQANVTKALNIDARSTGHYCKSLEEKGAIVRNGVSTNKIRTNICTHVRFVGKSQVIDIADEDVETVPYNVSSKGKAYSQVGIRDALIDLIKDSPDEAMLSEDVLRALGFNSTRKLVRKWFNRVIDELCSKGYIRKSDLKVDGKGLRRRCLHLLKTPTSNEKNEDLPMDPLEFPIKIKTMKEDVPILHVLIDSSLESQILQVLLASGENGATQREIGFALNLDEHRILYKLLERMVEMKDAGLQRYGALRFLEFEGRQRRYRYFTYKSYKMKYENLEIELPPLPAELDESTFYHNDYFIDLPHSQKEFQRYIKKTRNVGSLRINAKKGVNPTTLEKKKGRPKKIAIEGQPAPEKSPYVRKAAKAAASKNIGSSDAETASTSVICGPTVPAPEANVTIPSETFPISEAIVSNVSISEGASTLTATTSQSSQSRPVVHKLNLARIFDPPKRGRAEDVGEEVAKKAKHIQKTSGEAIIQAIPANVEQVVISEDDSSGVHLNGHTPDKSMDIDKISSVESASACEPIPSPNSAPMTVIEDKTIAKSTVATEPLPAVDLNIVTDAPISTQHVSAKGKDKKKAAATTPTRKLRTRTIADYFKKACAKVTDEPEMADTSEQVAITHNPKTTPVASSSSASSDETDSTNNASVPGIILPEPTTIASDRTTLLSDPVVVTSENSPTEMSEMSMDVSQNAGVDSGVDTIMPTTSQSLSPKDSDVSLTESPTHIGTTDVTEPANSIGQRKYISSVPPVIKTFTQPLAGFKAGYSHNRPEQVNVYMEARAKILLALLQDEPMWEMNKDLMDAYLVKAKELNGDFKYTVCNKTLWRSATLLSKRNEAQTITINAPLLYGGFNVRKLLIRNDIDLEGPECKNFQARLIERRALQTNRSIPRSFDTTTEPVESLEGRITRLRSKLQGLEDGHNTFEATKLKEHIGELSYNAHKFKARRTGNNLMASWQIRAMQFGWIRSKMLRVKLLYTEMYNLMMKNESLPGVDKEKRCISTVTFVTNMRVGTVCKMIGVYDPSQKLLNYLGDSAHMDVICSDLPVDIRKELLSDTNRFRGKLRSLLYGLEYLELAKSTTFDNDDKDRYRHLAISYHLPRVVSIKDRRRIGQPVIREHTLDSQVDVTLFWSELKYSCTQLTDEIPEDEMETPPTDPKAYEYWKGMYHMNNWTVCSVLARNQRKILNSYVDKIKGTTPLENTSICTSIAEEIDMPLQDIRKYYIKVETAMSQKREHRARKAVEAKLFPIKRRIVGKRSRNYGGRRVINLSSTRAFNSHDKMKNLGLDAKFEKGGTHEPLEGEDTYLDNLKSTPVIIGAPNIVDLRARRNKRMVWSDEEDDLLVYCYIIMRQRTRSLIRWHRVNQIFSTKPPGAGRHRIAKLLVNPVRAEQVESASILWSRFYVEGLQREEIEDPDPCEIINFDLLSLLAYFLKRLNENDTHTQTNILPKNVSDIPRFFDYHYNDVEKKAFCFENVYFEKATMVQRLSLLNLRTFTGRKLFDSDTDVPLSEIEYEDEIESRQLRIVMGYAMMSLMTPTEVYDPFFAYAIISSYSSDLFDLAVLKMRERNCLIKSKRERSVPGTKFSMSARFNTLMCGVFPLSLFKQAQEYDKYLSSQSGKNRIAPEFISSGMMACILDLISDNKMNVVMANRESKLKTFKTMSFSNRLTNRSLTVFEMDVEKTELTQIDPIKLDPKETKITCLDELKLEVEFGHFLKSKDSNTGALLKAIVSALKIRGGLGLTLYQLKVQIGSEYDDDAIRRGIHLLESNDPAFISPVGFGALRYVTIENIGTWSINTKEFLRIDPLAINSEVQNFKKNFDHIEKKAIILPNIWTDVNGNRTDLIVRDCKKVLVEYVMRRPGTSEAHIHDRFQAAFERTALHNLLDVLVNENLLKRVQVTQCSDQKTRKSIFSRNHNLKCSNDVTIEEVARTFYFVQPNPSANALN